MLQLTWASSTLFSSYERPADEDRYGHKLIKLCKDYRSSDEYIKENILLIEAILCRTAIQTNFLKRVHETLSEEHSRVHFEAFEMLKSKLMIALTKLESVVSESSVRKWKLLLVRKNIGELVDQLQCWQRVFDPSWFLILRINKAVIDTELTSDLESVDTQSLTLTMPPAGNRGSTSTVGHAQFIRGIIRGSAAKVHIYLSQDGLDWENTVSVPFATARIIRRNNSLKRFLVESIQCNPTTDITSTRQGAEELAKRLHPKDTAQFGLLTCYGLVKRKDKDQRHITSLNLVFSVPSEKAVPVSLRQRLVESRNFSLTATVDLARQLAQAVCFIHACDFVHKNLRPETIVLFPDKDSTSLGSAHLLGFDSFRRTNFHTALQGDSAWERNLYHHPTRQGLRAQERYKMQHDVYSLGVCLLEIGLWQTFVDYKSAEGEGETPIDTQGLSGDGNEPETVAQGKPPSTKDRLLAMAKSQLPIKLGDRYTAVVVTCLTCLDDDSVDFGEDSDMQDEDGVLIGVRFIEKVLFRLSEISL